MSFKKMGDSNNLFIKQQRSIQVLSRWTCFEVLFTCQNTRVRHVLQVEAPLGTFFTLDTFAFQKVLQETHEASFDSAQAWLEAHKNSLDWPEGWKISFLESSVLSTFAFENELLPDQKLIETLRFICPRSTQPFYGHLRYKQCCEGRSEHKDMEEKVRWSLLQMRSEPLEVFSIAERLQELCHDSSLEISWSLSRRGGISYQGSTIQRRYQRSVIE